MRIGVYTFATDRDMPPGRLATEVESRGFTELMFTEHSHIPVSRQTPLSAGVRRRLLPDFYQRTYDPFVACSFAAAATSTLQVGTGICLVALRDPIHTAKEVASVDRLSGGRFVFGVGFGWNADEFDSHRVAFGQRHAIVAEKVALMRTLWTRRGRRIPRRACPAAAELGLAEADPSAAPARLPRRQRPAQHGARGALGRRLVSDLAGRARLAGRRGRVVRRAGGEGRTRSGHRAGGLAPAPATEAELASYRDAGLERVDVAVVAGSDDDLLRGLDDLAKLRDAVR